MEVVLLSYTHHAEQLCAAAAHGCYSTDSVATVYKNMLNSKVEELINKVMKNGHHSVIEHAVYTFSVEGVSRTLTHQLVRHRIASFSQQSQRYVKIGAPQYVLPPSVESDSMASKIFSEAMDRAWESYEFLSSKGIPKQDARFVLPNACETNITFTMNARELLHFFSLRLDKHAQWEIREMAGLMWGWLQDASPLIFKKEYLEDGCSFKEE